MIKLLIENWPLIVSLILVAVLSAVMEKHEYKSSNVREERQSHEKYE